MDETVCDRRDELDAMDDGLDEGRCTGDVRSSLSFGAFPNTAEIAGRIFARLELVGIVSLNPTGVPFGVDGLITGACACR